MTARPTISEWVPADGTGYYEYDTATYKNNRNLRPISPYARQRQLSPVVWRVDPDSSRKVGHMSLVPTLVDRGIQSSLIARCKVKNLDNLDMIMLTRDLKEAVTGTTSFMLKVPRTIRLLKQGRFAEAARNQGYKGRKSIPNTYLGYTYAVSPLVSDCAHLWDFATRDQPPVFKTVKSAKKEVGSSKTYNLTSFIGNELQVTFEQKVQHSVRVVRYYSTDAFLDLKGLSFNPIPTVWDAIPYSFIVDWFIPIGDSLKMISYTGVRPVSGYNCYRVRNKHSVTFPNGVISQHPRNPSLFFQYGSGLPQAESFYFERTVDNTLTWTLPEAAAAFRNSTHLSLRRLLNAAMMAWQAVL